MSRNRLKKSGRGNQLLNWFKRYFTNYYSPRKYRTQRGFVLPMVIGIGLLMVLLSVTIIVRSQSSQVSTSNLKQAVQGSEVAETGVTRIQSLFAQFNQLPRTTLENIPVTNPTATTWTVTSGISPASCNASDPNLADSKALLNSIFKKNETTIPPTRAWVTIDSKSRFRVISYDYTPISTTGVTTKATLTTAFTIAANTNTGTATNFPSGYLTTGASVFGNINGIPGTLNYDGTNYTFSLLKIQTTDTTFTVGSIFYPVSNTTANTESGIGKLWVEGQVVSDTTAANPTVFSTAGIEVGIPVNPGNIITIPIPGSWISTNFNGPNNSNNFLSNVYTGCDITVNGTLGVDVPAPYTKKQTPLQLPQVPTAPAGTPVLGDITSPYSLPKTSGYNPTTGAYEYIVRSINLNGSDALSVNPNFKVTIYLQGATSNLVASSDGEIVYTNDPLKYPTTAYPPYNGTNNSTTTITIPAPTTPVTLADPSNSSNPIILPANSTSSTVIPSNSTSYLTIGGQSVYGNITYGTSAVPGKLSKSLTGNTYTFTPVDAPSAPISVPANSTFTPTTSFKGPNFKIYGNGAVGSKICIKGNRNLYAFILAPNYAVGTTGGAQIFGAVWAGAWGINLNGTNSSCGSANDVNVVTQDVTWDDVSALAPLNLPPSVQPIQTWIKKEGT